jgi:hypothetical protein
LYDFWRHGGSSEEVAEANSIVQPLLGVKRGFSKIPIDQKNL